MEESKKTLQEYLDFNYSELDLSTLELANAKRLVMCIKPSLRKLNNLERKYNAAKKEYEEEQSFQESILDTYTTGLDKLIEKGTVVTATLPVEEEVVEEPAVEAIPEETPEEPNQVPQPDSSKEQESPNHYTDSIGDILNPFS